jgi:hypothetical protein
LPSSYIAVVDQIEDLVLGVAVQQRWHLFEAGLIDEVTGKLKIIKILKRSDSGIKTEPGTKD